MNIRKLAIAGAMSAVALGAGMASSQAAMVAIIDGITVTDYGRIDPTTPGVVQPPGTISGTAKIETGSTGTLPNPGYNPYGPGVTGKEWWNLYSGTVSFATAGKTLNLLWGSPNYNVPYRSNSLSFYSGTTLLGTVLASDLYANFTGITNDPSPGYVLSFTPPAGYDKVVAGIIGTSSDYEFAFLTAVPEPATWAMMFAGFGGLAFLGWKRKRQPIAMAL